MPTIFPRSERFSRTAAVVMAVAGVAVLLGWALDVPVLKSLLPCMSAMKVIQVKDRTLVPVEKPVVARDGSWFAMRMMPYYRTMDDRIDGVVLTFTDTSVARKLEAEVRAQQQT